MAVVIDLEERRKPITYTIEIEHHYDGTLRASIPNMEDSEVNRAMIAEVLRSVADTLSEPQGPHYAS